MYDDGFGFGGLLVLGLVLLPVLLLFFGVFYVVSSLFLMRIFDRAGVEGRWRAWVPVYNLMVLAKLGDLSPWVMLGAFAVSAVLGQTPGIGFLFNLVLVAAAVLAAWRVGLKLDRDWPLLLLWLIPGIGTVIWLGIVAYGHAPWNPAVGPSPWRTTFLRDTTVWQGIPVQPDQSAAGAPGAPGAAYPGAGYPPPGGHQPPAGYQQPPAGLQQPPAGYQPPPPGYQPPPPGYQPPAPPHAGDRADPDAPR
jgi:hypothetical protein